MAETTTKFIGDYYSIPPTANVVITLNKESTHDQLSENAKITSISLKSRSFLSPSYLGGSNTAEYDYHSPDRTFSTSTLEVDDYNFGSLQGVDINWTIEKYSSSFFEKKDSINLIFSSDADTLTAGNYYSSINSTTLEIKWVPGDLTPAEKTLIVSNPQFTPSLVTPSSTVTFSYSALTNSAGTSGLGNKELSNISLVNKDTGAMTSISATQSGKTLTFSAPSEIGTYYILFNVLVRDEKYSEYYSSYPDGVYLTVSNKSSEFVTFANFTIAGKTSNIYVGSKGIDDSEIVTAAWTINDPYNKVTEANFYYTPSNGVENHITAKYPVGIQEMRPGGGYFNQGQDTTTFKVVALAPGLAPKEVSSDEIIVTNIKPAPWTEFRIDGSSDSIISIPTKTVTLTWAAPTLEVGEMEKISAYSYEYRLSDSSEFLTGGTISTSTSTLSLTIPESYKGKTYIVYRLKARIDALDGGYEEITSNEVTVRLVGNPNPPTIIGYYDTRYTGTITSTTMIPYAYNTIRFTISPATENIENNSGTRFSYSLRYVTAGGTVNTIQQIASEEDAEFTYDFDFSSFEEKTALTFNILAEDIDNPGITVSSESVTITKFERPKIRVGNISVSAINKDNYDVQMINQITVPFTITRSIYDNFTSDISYSVALLDPQAEITQDGYWFAQTGSSGIISSNESNATATFNFTCPSSANLESENITKFEKLVYQNVIVNQNPETSFAAVIICQYKDYVLPVVTLSKVTNFDFRRTVPDLTSSSYIVNYPENRTYFNAFEPYTISLKPTAWTDAAGELIGGNILYSLTRDAGSVKPQITNLEASDVYAYGESDIQIQYELKHTISYSGATNEITSNSKTTSISVQIARWTSEEVGLRNLVLDGENASGYITFTGGAYPCGSLDLQNTVLTGAQYEVRNNDVSSSDDPNFIVSTGEITSEQITAGEIQFSSPYELLGASLYAVIKFKNTANAEQSSQSAIYILRDAATTFAIRKGRLGINVASNFGGDGNEEEFDTLQINQKDQVDPGVPVVTIKANQTDTSYINSFIDFRNMGNDSYGKIYEHNGMLYFSGANKTEDIEILAQNFNANGEYVIENSYITENSIQEIFPSSSINLEQYNAFNNACLIGTTQKVGECTIKALGTIPTINIPVTLLIRGV